MQSRAFAGAVRPAPRKILRVWLKPYSLGHELLLIAENNPLLFEPDGFDELPLNSRANAVQRAVSICSRTWAENNKPDKNQALWFWLIRKCDRLEACQEFREYRRAGTTFPDMVPGTGAEHDRPGSPFTARLLDFACQMFGERGYDQPMGMLQWLYFARSEEKGWCKVKNSFLLQRDAEISAIEADYKKEQQCQH